MFQLMKDLFTPAAPKPLPPMTSQTSMNFASDEVAPFLTQLANNPRLDFPADLAKEVRRNLACMAVEDTRRWRVTGAIDDQPIQMEIEAFMDDVDAPDLYFFSTQAAISEIERELEAFAEAIGT
jgi:hypothetical protein